MEPSGRAGADTGKRSIGERVREWDRRILSVLNRRAITLLRIALGIVFVWFGALKVGNVSPVTDLVARTVYWVDPEWFVPVLGIVEIAIGVGLLAGILLRAVLFLFFLQMAGTFIVLVVLPEVAFQRGNVLLLTTEGEFVVKNLVLLTAGLVVGTTVRRRKKNPADGRGGAQPR